MTQKSSDFVNLQKMIELKNQASFTEARQTSEISAAMHLSSYELVSFLRTQINRADENLMCVELNMSDVKRIAK